jgi:hypothetical protein
VGYRHVFLYIGNCSEWVSEWVRVTLTYSTHTWKVWSITRPSV